MSLGFLHRVFVEDGYALASQTRENHAEFEDNVLTRPMFCFLGRSHAVPLVIRSKQHAGVSDIPRVS
jgi:hypothetical protein